MHSVNFYSFRVLTHKGSRTSKRLNNLGLSDKKQHMNYLLSILIAIKTHLLNLVSRKQRFLLNNTHHSPLMLKTK